MSKAKLVVSLRAVVAEMDLPNDEWTAYLNRRTGELVTVTDEEASAVEDEADADDVGDCGIEHLQKVREVLASPEFLPLPTKFDLDEYRIMERFCLQVEDSAARDDLLRAIKGSGAFGRFKAMAQRHGLIDPWYAWRDRAFEEIAVAWLEENGIGYSRDEKPRDAWADEKAGLPSDNGPQSGPGHFDLLNGLAESCAAKGITLYSHHYDDLAFGSWTLVAGHPHERLQFTWDGKESHLDLAVSHFDSMNSPARWAPLPDASLTAPPGGQAAVFRYLLERLLERYGIA